jgi:arginyl-tRNA synthetase
MLTRKNDAPLDFDFDKVLEQAKENPVFYVQYAHARVRSALRKAEGAGIEALFDGAGHAPAPMTDEDARPFAGLADLRNPLEDDKEW